MTRTPLLLSTIFGLCLGACGGEAKKDAETKMVTTHSCTIIVGKKAGAPFEGKGNDADKAKAEEAAWTDACAKLPEADRAGCRDDKKFSSTKAEMSVTANGTASYSVTITLAPVIPQVEGKADAQTTKEDACKAATVKACEAAGAKGDCLASGEYEKRGEMTKSSTTKTTETPK